MNGDSLVNKARKIKTKNSSGGRLANYKGFRLAMAWAKSEGEKGRITTSQVNLVLGRKPYSANALYYLAPAFKWAIQNGLLVEKKVGNKRPIR